MSEIDQERVFEGFFEPAGSKILNPHGTRLSLLFCKKVCQSLEGDINIKQSSPEVGTVVTFTMRVFKTESNANTSDHTIGSSIFGKANKAKQQKEQFNAFDILESADLRIPPNLDKTQQIIKIKGVTFDLNKSRTNPIKYESLNSNQIKQLEGLTTFLYDVQKLEPTGKVIIVESIFKEKIELRRDFTDYGIDEKLAIVSGGQALIIYLR